MAGMTTNGLRMITEDTNLGLKARTPDLHTHHQAIGGSGGLTSLGIGTSFLSWVASIAAIYLLILDRTKWRTNILTGLLIPYIFLSLPSLIFNIFRGEVRKWIALVAVVLRFFFPRQFPDSWFGVLLCLIIACYLLQEHIRASGGFRNSFMQPHGISNAIGMLILLVYPVRVLVVHFL